MHRLKLKLPGRLGNPKEMLHTDARTDPRIVRALLAAGGEEADLVPAIAVPDQDATYEECLEYVARMEADFAVDHPHLRDAMPQFESVATSTQCIPSVDANDLRLHIHQPKERDGALPCIVHLHGGGMVQMTAEDPDNIRWRSSLAALGLVVVGVEFRNGGGCLGNHPFPAGLNDCASAAQWAFANKTLLNVSGIVLSGESGGGNLSLATALKANREGWIDQIAGVYAICPYIWGDYAAPPADLLSLQECDGYLLSAAQMGVCVKVYDPAGEHGSNPLAWPLKADDSDLRGLPPHLISVHELDPLRDEGIAYYRKLLAAEVPVKGRTMLGTPHAGEMFFPDVIPDFYQDSLRSVCQFANLAIGAHEAQQQGEKQGAAR